ncbi:MAG: PP2C family protein-serine/threonine phosphatase [Eubacteriales bacterium]
MKKNNIEVGACSHKGHYKKENQDRLIVKIGEDAIGEFGLFAVADGVSSFIKSSKASQYIIEQIDLFWTKEMSKSIYKSNNTIKIIEKIITTIKNSHNYIINTLQNERLGTTLSLLFVRQGSYGIIHIGDSRIYVYKNRKLIQLTKDHTYVQGLIDKNKISQKNAKKNSRRHILTQCIGGSPIITLDSKIGQISNEDIYLICSDGLYDEIKEKEIVKILDKVAKKKITSQEGVQVLLKSVLNKKAKDNITIIIVKGGYF